MSSLAEAERAVLAELNEARQRTPHPLGSLPLVILTRATGANKERIAAYDQLATISPNSRHTVVANADHEIHLYQLLRLWTQYEKQLGLRSTGEFMSMR